MEKKRVFLIQKGGHDGYFDWFGVARLSPRPAIIISETLTGRVYIHVRRGDVDIRPPRSLLEAAGHTLFETGKFGLATFQAKSGMSSVDTFAPSPMDVKNIVHASIRADLELVSYADKNLVQFAPGEHYLLVQSEWMTNLVFDYEEIRALNRSEHTIISVEDFSHPTFASVVIPNQIAPLEWHSVIIKARYSSIERLEARLKDSGLWDALGLSNTFEFTAANFAVPAPVEALRGYLSSARKRQLKVGCTLVNAAKIRGSHVETAEYAWRELESVVDSNPLVDFATYRGIEYFVIRMQDIDFYIARREGRYYVAQRV